MKEYYGLVTAYNITSVFNATHSQCYGGSK
ncbi:hypothetical protein A5875_004449 [Enterococcus sp. 3H8_DIV0648]|nr:hypothetical protein A5875_004449 [Enterococcus sp. 3H8_DIV0648]